MAILQPQVESLTIVLIGDFNPKIFHPLWFSINGLVRAQESEDAKIEMVHHEVADFRFDWLRVQVTRERFALTTTQVPYYEPLRDLVLGTFKTLAHTPVRMMGINFEEHYSMRSFEEYNRLGDILTPKEPWSGLSKPGLRSLTMLSERIDNYSGYIQVKVEPSPKLTNGVSFHINDHYELLSDGAKIVGSKKAVDALTDNWENSFKYSKEIINSLLEKV